MAVDWGSLPDWLAGIAGTIVAGGLFWEVRQRRLADARADAERRDAEASHARLVSTHVETTLDDRCILRVVNDGPGPIQVIEIWFRAGDATTFDMITTEVIRGGTTIPASSLSQFDVRTPLVDVLGEVEDLEVAVEFIDLHGFQWSRVGMEQPQRVLPLAVSESKPRWKRAFRRS
ncbi:hypothetical protein AB0J82_20845 [Asanoa sp. NPDC049518]|uniref:hypothetical protein n=1 Tax=unclassified Asanoa TaxID=2685164 RepID=UPI00343A4751